MRSDTGRRSSSSKTRRFGCIQVSALAMLLLLPAAALAQEALPRSITLDEALSIAMDQNRDVQKAAEYQKWVRGKYVEERAAALPQFTLTGSQMRQHDESQRGLYGDFAELFPVQQDIRSGEVGMTQALYTWGQVGAAIRAAKVGMRSAEEGLRLARQAARRDVTAAFYDVLLAKDLAAIARENLAQKERHYEEAVKKQELGTATDYDVLAARVAVENARPAVIRSESAVKTARQNLAFLLADPAGEVDVDGALEASPTEPASYASALETARAHRPDLKDLALRTEVRRELVKIAGAGDKPRLDFRAAYGTRMFLVGDLDSHGKTWNAGVYLSFPIFDGMRTRGRVIQARSDLTTAQIEEARASDAAALEVRTAVDAVRENASVLTALSGTVDQAKRLLEMAEKGYEYGVKTKLDVDDAQVNLASAEGNLSRAVRDYLVARTNLAFATGTLGEE